MEGEGREWKGRGGNGRGGEGVPVKFWLGIHPCASMLERVVGT